MAREAGRKAKMMTRNTAPMGRLTAQISSLPGVSRPVRGWYKDSQ